MSETSAINETDAKRWVGEILSSWKRSREIREEAKERIRPDLEHEVEHRTGLYEAAEAAGLPLSALKLEVARQKDDWENDLRKKKREAKAGQEVVETADMIREALGEFSALPLGGAAVEAARKFVEGVEASGNTVTITSASSSVTVGGKKRGRPSNKAAGAPLAGQDDGTDPLSKIGRGLN